MHSGGTAGRAVGLIALQVCRTGLFSAMLTDNHFSSFMDLHNGWNGGPGECFLKAGPGVID